SHGIYLHDDATVTLDGTSVSAAGATFYSYLESSGQSQQITVRGNSVATVNDGNLLVVSREDAGMDGVVTLYLEDGSVTAGDIVDEEYRGSDDKYHDAADDGGGVDVFLGELAVWNGDLLGVRGFYAEQGSNSTIGDGSKLHELNG